VEVAASRSSNVPARNPKLVALITLTASMVISGSGVCQSPAGPPFGVYAKGGPQRVFGLTYNADDGVRVSWLEGVSPLSQPGPGDQWAQDFEDNDLNVDLPFLLMRIRKVVPNHFPGGPIAGNPAGNLLLAFSSWRPNVNRYGFDQGRKNLKLDTSAQSYFRGVTGVAIDDRGDFVVAWESRGQEGPDRGTTDSGIFARLVDSRGIPVGPEIHVNTIEQGYQRTGRVAMAAATGAFVVVWETNPSGEATQVAGQLFAPDGTKVGGEFRVGSLVPGQWLPNQRVSMAPDGSFVVVWEEPDLENGGSDSIFGQRFSAQGLPLGSVFRVNEVPSGSRGPAIASDPRGNFVVIWRAAAGITMSRLYHADGTPAGRPVALTSNQPDSYSFVAFGRNGTFAVAGTHHPTGSTGVDLALLRRFSASPGEEICGFEEDSPIRQTEIELFCETGRTGTLLVRHPLLGSQPGDVGLLGDIDGDGRADPCLFRNGVFFCDADHDYIATDTVVGFGQTGDRPFLADLDGDGRADPCVYRAGRFLCDTAHDGGTAELEIPFGAAGDTPLLGDIDGDGRGDPCVFRAGRFLCDTTHDGTSDVEIQFGGDGGPALLGDFDGDGRADPCIFDFALQCDTGHDGGRAEGILFLSFGHVGLVPQLGNLDGL